jgi:hypothetical protein
MPFHHQFLCIGSLCLLRPKVYFYIHNQLDGKVFDVQGSFTASGTRVVSYMKTSPQHDNQLWFEDIKGNLRSKLNENVVLDATGKGNKFGPIAAC